MPIKIKLETKADKKAEQAINNLKDGYVKIGWFEGQKEPNGLLVSENAYMQNTGFTIKHKNGKSTYVPPRPFMDITLNRYGKEWNSFWKEAYKQVSEGKAKLTQVLNKLGIKVKSNIQDTIISSDGIRPNTPSTLASKKAKGHGTIPLIDSRTMLQTINYHSEVGK